MVKISTECFQGTQWILNSIQQASTIQYFFYQKQMPKSSRLHILLLFLVLLEMASAKGTFLTDQFTPPSTSVPCSQCRQNYIADNEYNAERLQSYIINGIKYQRDATYFSQVFQRYFPLYFTKAFLDRIKYFKWRTENQLSSCRVSIQGSYDRDMQMSISQPVTGWYTLKQLAKNEKFLKKFMAKNPTLNKQKFARKVIKLQHKKFLKKISSKIRRLNKIISDPSDQLQWRLIINGLDVNPVLTYQRCIRTMLLLYKNPDGYTPLNNFYQDKIQGGNPEKANQDLNITKKYYYDLLQKISPKTLEEILRATPWGSQQFNETVLELLKNGICEVDMDQSYEDLDLYLPDLRKLQQIQDDSDFYFYKIPLENLAPGEVSIFDPSRISELAIFDLSPEMFAKEGEEMDWDVNSFVPGESEFTIWADYAALLFGPVLYCQVPGILQALEASCPATCA